MAGRIGLRVPVSGGALARPDTVSPAQVWTTPKWFDRCLVALIPLMVLLYLCGFMVNYGPSMSHLGWVYKTSWGTQPTRVGQIVRFAQPGQPAWRKFILPSVKRVAAITPTGLWLEGDNTEQSQDSRDWNKTVPPDHIAGVVTSCWSPKRMLRSWTAEGRLRNWVEFNYNPNCVQWRSASPQETVWAYVAYRHWAYVAYRQVTFYNDHNACGGPVSYNLLLGKNNTGWADDGHFVIGQKDENGYPILKQWMVEEGLTVLKQYRPVVVTKTMPGRTVRALCANSGQDPTQAFTKKGWGPVLPNSNAYTSYNWIEVSYDTPQKVSEITVHWSGGRGVLVWCSDDGIRWRGVPGFQVSQPQPGKMRTKKLQPPVTARHWQLRLLGLGELGSPGATLTELQLR